MVGDIHTFLGQAAIYVSGAVGVWAAALAFAKRPLPRTFFWVAGLAITMFLVQVSLGLWMYQGGFDPGSAHLFYGVVILFTVAFAYVYRAQFERRPALAWSLFMLFMSGLGIRGWLNFLVWF
ncbi:MAG: hypothetical protein JSV07_00400 [Acidimicrobiia bacterium]|jgi:hypothetical protein|nr:MAG: hypothetical protein JSV07_00400 [Acidimicrobiia bacterium]